MENKNDFPVVGYAVLSVIFAVIICYLGVWVLKSYF